MIIYVYIRIKSNTPYENIIRQSKEIRYIDKYGEWFQKIYLYKRYIHIFLSTRKTIFMIKTIVRDFVRSSISYTTFWIAAVNWQMSFLNKRDNWGLYHGFKLQWVLWSQCWIHCVFFSYICAVHFIVLLMSTLVLCFILQYTVK